MYTSPTLTNANIKSIIINTIITIRFRLQFKLINKFIILPLLQEMKNEVMLAYKFNPLIVKVFIFRVKGNGLSLKLFSFCILQMSFSTVKRFCCKTKEICLISMYAFWKEANFSINRIYCLDCGEPHNLKATS